MFSQPVHEPERHPSAGVPDAALVVDLGMTVNVRRDRGVWTNVYTLSVPFLDAGIAYLAYANHQWTSPTGWILTCSTRLCWAYGMELRFCYWMGDIDMSKFCVRYRISRGELPRTSHNGHNDHQPT
jgi:hypothetical protein